MVCMPLNNTTDDGLSVLFKLVSKNKYIFDMNMIQTDVQTVSG